ncbi:DUF2288 domain-containing protein [Marinobacter confluentis]|uniref:DUF2288 domain-containing protein n=1 Tax=Marinobacter confluentis TaxID=1697557 RepID=A0A4Z1C7Q7_9GAMM|nr:DUF2288 domain-containing protein [Marinobacter confluentis]TGN38828.1 DUF2288 domain-containing protein [Marinobacter confluentis]
MVSDESREELLAKLNLETSQIKWRDLQTYFARGHVVRVAPALDLLAVAAELTADNKVQFEQWMSAGQVGEVTPDHARHWYEQDSELWAVVVAPWVLVQDRNDHILH